jgi:hypothetical protein
MQPQMQAQPAPVLPWLYEANANVLWLGPNDSSINRGDRADTGDEEARPTEKGSGEFQPTFDSTSLGGESSIAIPPGGSDMEEELRDMDGFEIVEATDGRLGLTDIGDVPADDWAADTGPTRSSEEL